jgi:hypothetical protein
MSLMSGTAHLPTLLPHLSLVVIVELSFAALSSLLLQKHLPLLSSRTRTKSHSSLLRDPQVLKNELPPDNSVIL